MVRARDYIPLSLWPEGEPGNPYRNQTTHDRRWRIFQALVGVSILANVYFFYTSFTSWPAPLDNYQSL